MQMSCIREHILFPLSFVEVFPIDPPFLNSAFRKKKDKNNNKNICWALRKMSTNPKTAVWQTW